MKIINFFDDNLNLRLYGHRIILTPAANNLQPFKMPTKGTTLNDVFNFPLQVYISDQNHRLIKVNEDCAEACQFDSPESCFGLVAEDFMEACSARNASMIIIE